MVGVASPLFRVRGAIKFHAGFALGNLSSALFLSALLIPVSLVVASIALPIRAAVVTAIIVVCAILDSLDRTPQRRRQVPQRFGLQGLPYGHLGFVYGVDVGLHATTQRTSSLGWVAIGASVIFGPPGVVAATLLTAAAIHSLTTVLLSAFDQRTITQLQFWGWSTRTWIRATHLVSVTVLAITAWLMIKNLVPLW